jgi:hypothetical protein
MLSLILVCFLLGSTDTAEAPIKFAGNVLYGKESDGLIATYACQHPLPIETEKLFTHVAEKYPITIYVEFADSSQDPASTATLTQQLGTHQNIVFVPNHQELTIILSKWLQNYFPWTLYSHSIERLVQITVTVPMSTSLSSKQFVKIKEFQATLPIVIDLEFCSSRKCGKTSYLSVSPINTANKYSEQKPISSKKLQEILYLLGLPQKGGDAIIDSHSSIPLLVETPRSRKTNIPRILIYHIPGLNDSDMNLLEISQPLIPSNIQISRVSCSKEAQSRSHIISQCPKFIKKISAFPVLFCESPQSTTQTYFFNPFTISRDLQNCYNFVSGITNYYNFKAISGSESNELINQRGHHGIFLFHFNPDYINDHRMLFKSIAAEYAYGNDLNFYEVNCLNDRRNIRYTYCDHSLFRFHDIFYVIRSPSNIIVIDKELSQKELRKYATGILGEKENGADPVF